MHKHTVYSKDWMASYTPADQDLAPARWGLGWFLAESAFRLVLKLAGLMEKRRIRAELTAMDDRELADIGLVRTDIERVAQGRFETRGTDPKARSGPRETAALLPRLAA